MLLHTAHIAASAARHQCLRYLKVAQQPELAASLLPPDAASLPTPQFPLPSFPRHPLLPMLKAFRDDAPHRWLFAPRTSVYDTDSKDQHGDHINGQRAHHIDNKIEQPSTTSVHQPNDVAAWLQQPEPRACFFVHGTLYHRWGAVTLCSDPLLLRKVTIDGRRYILLGQYTHRANSHQTRLELGLIAACIYDLLTQAAANTPDGSQQHLVPPDGLQIDGCLLPYDGTAGEQKAALLSFLRGDRSFDLKAYQGPIRRWLGELMTHEARGLLPDAHSDSCDLHAIPLSWGPWCENTANGPTPPPPQPKGCPLHQHCMVDLSARSDVALIPGVTPDCRDQLVRHGLKRHIQLANAKQLSSSDAREHQRVSLPPHPDGVAETNALMTAVTPGPGLDLLVQRARRMARRHALKHRLKAPTARNSLSCTSGFRIPDEARHPGMQRLFLDLQCAPETGHIYILTAALNLPPQKDSTPASADAMVLALTERYPPDRQDEERLWLGWCESLQRSLKTQLERGSTIHLYMTHRDVMRQLLGLWKRHKEITASRFPQLITWLHQEALYMQDMASFVCAEVQHHLNQPTSSTSLYAQAMHAGYQWHWPEQIQEQLPASFYSTRAPKAVPGWLYQTSNHWSHQLPDSAKRFVIDVINADEPSYMAHATSALTSLKRILVDRLHALAWLVRALPHAGMDGLTAESKLPLRAAPGAPTSPSQENDEPAHPASNSTSPQHSLAMLLYTEMMLARGMALSQYHESWAAPLKQKLYQGEALALRFDQTLSEGWQGSHCFRMVTAGPLQTPAELIYHRCRFVTGDVIVLGAAEEASQHWRHRRGWLGQIETIIYPQDPTQTNSSTEHNAPDSGEPLIQLKGLAWLGKGQPETAYAWRHRKAAFVHDQLYILSAAADTPARQRHQKLFRDAVGYPQVIERLMTPVRSESIASNDGHYGSVALPGTHLTPQQQRCVSLAQETRCLVLLGPPGTGKTETAMASALQAMRDAQAAETPCRIFLCTKHPHNLQTTLELLARLETSLQGQYTTSPLPDNLDENDGSTTLFQPMADIIWISTKAIEALSTREQEVETGQTPGSRQWQTFRPELVNRKLYKRRYLCLAGTPSDAYKIYQKHGIDVQFDLIICDDGQNFHIEEGLMAMLSLGPRGHVMVTGDPASSVRLPSHPWQRTSLDEVSMTDPDDLASWLASQRAAGVRPSFDLHVERLHQGFRLPTAITALLDRGPYWQDFPRPSPETTGFTSLHQSRKERGAPTLPQVSPALSQAWPEWIMASSAELFVLVHDEESSHQVNDFEGRLIAALFEHHKAHGPESIGIIASTRRQKRQLTAALARDIDGGNSRSKHCRVGTADDFAGQQRDIMIVSSTLSIPMALQQEQHMMLHPQRQWLAWSRHRKKLIVVVSRAAFAQPLHTAASITAQAPWQHLRATAARMRGRWEWEEGGVEIWSN